MPLWHIYCPGGTHSPTTSSASGRRRSSPVTEPEASDQAVEDMIDATRSYISDFAEAVQSATDADELVAMMLAKYETLGNPWTLEFSARAWFSRDLP